MRDDQDLRLQSIGLQKGQTYRTVCPKCGGGSSKERCYVIRLDEAGRAHATCYRGSCGYYSHANASCGPSYDTGAGRGGGSSGNPIYPSGESLTREQCDFLGRKYNVHSEYWHHVNVRYTDRYGGRYLFPMLSWLGYQHGVVARSYRDDDPPKVLTLSDRTLPCIGFCLAAHDDKPKPLWVVEDLPSALCVQFSGGLAVALLGTHLTADMEMQILKAVQGLKIPKVVVALDNDAAGHTGNIKAYNKISNWHRAEIYLLPADFKDMDNETRKETLLHH